MMKGNLKQNWGMVFSGIIHSFCFRVKILPYSQPHPKVMVVLLSPDAEMTNVTYPWPPWIQIFDDQ